VAAHDGAPGVMKRDSICYLTMSPAYSHTG
jgi:hypothetical protein